MTGKCKKAVLAENALRLKKLVYEKSYCFEVRFMATDES